MPFAELIKDVKKRHAALMRIQKPYGKLFSVVSWILFAINFSKSTGKFSLTLLGLGALALFLLYHATSVAGIKSFARRSLALLVDLVLVSAALVALVYYYEKELEQPDDILQIHLSNLLMLALWGVFLYFAISDWRFGGTPGKRLLGLRVVGLEKDSITFARSFIRTFLCLPLPIISAALISHWVMGQLVMGQGPSSLRIFCGDALKNALTGFVPISIMFLEGNQSIVDRLTRTAIRANHEPIHLPPKISGRTWGLLCFSNMAWALLAATLFLIGVVRPWLFGPSRIPNEGGGATWILNDPRTAAALWAYLPLGLKDPTFGIRSIQLLETSPNPYTFDAARSHFLPPVNPQPYLKAAPKIEVIRIVLAREHPLQVKLLVVENFVSLTAQRTPRERRPAFAIVQIATEQAYGLFSVTEHENILAGWATSPDGTPLNFYSDIQPAGMIGMELSIDKIRFLLIGGGIPYTDL